MRRTVLVDLLYIYIVTLYLTRLKPIVSTPCLLSRTIDQAVGVELDLSAIASAAVNAATNGLRMDTYYPQEVSIVLTHTGGRHDGVFENNVPDYSCQGRTHRQAAGVPVCFLLRKAVL